MEDTQETRSEGFEKLRAIRMEKLERLRSAGIAPYPYRYAVTHKVEEIAMGTMRVEVKRTGEKSLIAADRANIPLDFRRAAAIDLAGRDILDAVQVIAS